MKNDSNTIRVAGIISTQRSYSDIILAISEELPSFFEFEGVAILLRDSKSNQLFSLEQDLNP